MTHAPPPRAAAQMVQFCLEDLGDLWTQTSQSAVWNTLVLRRSIPLQVGQTFTLLKVNQSIDTVELQKQQMREKKWIREAAGCLRLSFTVDQWVHKIAVINMIILIWMRMDGLHTVFATKKIKQYSSDKRLPSNCLSVDFVDILHIMETLFEPVFYMCTIRGQQIQFNGVLCLNTHLPWQVYKCLLYSLCIWWKSRPLSLKRTIVLCAML